MTGWAGIVDGVGAHVGGALLGGLAGIVDGRGAGVAGALGSMFFGIGIVDGPGAGVGVALVFIITGGGALTSMFDGVTDGSGSAVRRALAGGTGARSARMIDGEAFLDAGRMTGGPETATDPDCTGVDRRAVLEASP